MANGIIPPSVPVINFAWVYSCPRLKSTSSNAWDAGLISHVTWANFRDLVPDARISCSACQRSGGLAIVPKHAPTGWTA